MTHTPGEIRRLLGQFELAPRRELGQNFVADANTVRRVARLAEVGPGDCVVEIGPGLGSLTLALIETGADVTAVEVDRGLAAVTRSVVGDAATVVEADVREFDWSSVGTGSGPITVVANLPYNIATGLVVEILARVDRVVAMLVMVQSEVAERICAAPGSKAYGIPSVLVARHGAARIVGRVPASVFIPRPKVESSLVHIVRHEVPPFDIAHDALAAVVSSGFGQRRKMLRKSLAGLLTADQLDALGIEPTRRAEELGLADWASIAAAVESSG